MSFAFLTASATEAVARSPMERQARAAGARFEIRDGWNVAVAYEGEREALEQAVAWADASHLAKLEVAGAPPLQLELGQVALELVLADVGAVGEGDAVVRLAGVGDGDVPAVAQLEAGAGGACLALHRRARHDVGRVRGEELQRHERSTAPSGS